MRRLHAGPFVVCASARLYPLVPFVFFVDLAYSLLPASQPSIAFFRAVPHR